MHSSEETFLSSGTTSHRTGWVGVRAPLACEPCNQKKGAQDIEVFLKNKPELLARIVAQAKASLKDATAVNSSRWALFERLKAFGLPMECGSGGLTKFNRTQRGLPKAHWLDAVCVGHSTPETIEARGIMPLYIKATGHGCRQMCLMDRFGFPRTSPKAKHFKHGFRTGDQVRAVVPARLKNAGTHVGRLSAKASGGFTIATTKGSVTDIGKKYCCLLQRADGYGYSIKEGGDGVSSRPLNGDEVGTPYVLWFNQLNRINQAHIIIH
jgi:hypothetical protein